jgi:hypothetical protein
VETCRRASHLVQDRMQAVRRDIVRRHRQATCSLKEKTILPSADVFVHERSEVGVQIDVPNSGICFGIGLDLVTFFAALLTDVDYRATIEKCFPISRPKASAIRKFDPAKRK